MEPEHLIDLKYQVEKTFGRKILSSADCRYLCHEIGQWAQFKLSFNTIRRFFNLMKTDHQPSVYTLNALSNYCGFSSYDDFITSKQRDEEVKMQAQDSCLLDYLILLFKNTEVASRNDNTYYSLIQQTINYLDQHLYLVDRFQREIARTKNGQNFYFEQFINVDKLNSFYGEGLYYYLHEKKTRESRLFAHSLLCFRSWLTQNEKGILNHYRAILQENIDGTIRPSVCARYFATQLFGAETLGLDCTEVMAKARKFYSSHVTWNENYTVFDSFEIVISESLILTGHYSEALFYLEEMLKLIKKYIPSYVINVSLFETICLYKAIVLANTGKKSAAQEIMNDIIPYKFYFLSRQYHTILYLSLKNKIKSRKSEKEQICHLIQETGFTKLSTINEFELI
jgi:hypothetical protein